jgi:hypothetical protein
MLNCQTVFSPTLITTVLVSSEFTLQKKSNKRKRKTFARDNPADLLVFMPKE